MDVPMEVFLPHECKRSSSCPPPLECGKPLSQASPQGTASYIFRLGHTG